LIGWAATYAQTALSYIELGDSGRAREICEAAYALLGERELEYVAYHSILEAAYAVTLAASGEQQRADELFERLLERLRASGEHTRVFLMHEYRVKVARMRGDRAALQRALREMRDAALTSGNPSAILLADAVANRRSAAGSSPPPPAAEPATKSTRSDEAVVTAFLKREQRTRRRAQHALHLLGQYADGGEGYLFFVKAGALELAASLDQRQPPSGLEDLLSALVGNEQRVTLSRDVYAVVRLAGVGLAALRCEDERAAEIPDSLISDISRGLRAG
jgi:tetratricopeptide (TPR) repeat protein